MNLIKKPKTKFFIIFYICFTTILAIFYIMECFGEELYCSGRCCYSNPPIIYGKHLTKIKGTIENISFGVNLNNTPLMFLRTEEGKVWKYFYRTGELHNITKYIIK